MRLKGYDLTISSACFLKCKLLPYKQSVYATTDFSAPQGSQSESMFTVPCIQSESNLLALSQAKKLFKSGHPPGPDEEHKPRLPDSIAQPITNMPFSRMENTTFAKRSITDSHDMGLRTVYSPDAQKKTPIQRLFTTDLF
ncbi:hypothetical protein TNCV_806181 [Trichonephila clavipes]|nr:hypothetical protein TNCV_806181 [Trichonephila clavipes]